jgi:hypothetical protein
MRMRATLAGCVGILAAVQPMTALASAEQVCALMSPFFDNPPQRFLSERGVKSSQNVWKMKSNPQADALNANCEFNTYGGEGTQNLWCTIGFEKDQLTEQEAAYNQSVLGMDFCASRLSFGEEWSRTVGHTVGKDLDTKSTSWYKTKDKEQFHFQVDAHHFKSSGSRDVKITIEYQNKKEAGAEETGGLEPTGAVARVERSETRVCHSFAALKSG